MVRGFASVMCLGWYLRRYSCDMIQKCSSSTKALSLWTVTPGGILLPHMMRPAPVGLLGISWKLFRDRKVMANYPYHQAETLSVVKIRSRDDIEANLGFDYHFALPSVRSAG